MSKVLRASFGIDERLMNKMREISEKSGRSVSDLIRETLERRFFEATMPELAHEIDIFGKVKLPEKADKKDRDKDDIRFPIGDVICYGVNPQTQLWWCPENKIKVVEERAKDWVENGFEFKIGQQGCGTWYMPEVIEELEQERGKNKRFGPSCKMVEAELGDKMVWLEITDALRALNFMKKRADIPCAVRCDVHKYSEDVEYAEAFDTANEFFIYYWHHGRNKRI